jgi:hypothetical protein
MPKKDNGLTSFIHAVYGSKEVGLVIAKDGKALANFVRSMDGMSFKPAETSGDFFKFPKTYCIVGDNIEKDVYDFVVQYSTGQVEIFDSELMRSRMLTPDYGNSAVVLGVTKENLKQLQAKGCDLLSSVGPAYQI